jgi:hypothetical protein
MLAGIFTMLVLQHFFIALGFGVAGALALLGWHHKGVHV